MLPADQVSSLGAEQALWQAGLYLAGVLLALGLAASVWAAWRNRLRRGGEDAAATWTLADIRRLREQGFLTQGESERLKEVILAGVTEKTQGAKPLCAPRKDYRGVLAADDIIRKG